MSDDTMEMVKLGLQVVIALGAAFGALGAYFGWQAKRAIQQVNVNLDGRLTQLLDQTGAASRAEGRDSMRTGDGLDTGAIGPIGPMGATGVQGPIGVQGPAGAQGIAGPVGESHGDK